MALKHMIISSLSEQYQTKEEITNQIVSIGFGHDRSSVERSLRALSEQGLIIQDESSRIPRYKKKVRQLEFIS